MILNLKLILLLYVFFIPHAYSEFLSTSKNYSKFNACLLEKDEYLFDLPFGNFYSGLTEDLEFGTNSLFWLLSLPNIHLKHKMFTTDQSQTSFTSFSFGLPRKEINHVKLSGIGSIHGIITTYQFNDKILFNSALMQGYILAHITQKDSLFGDLYQSFEFRTYGLIAGSSYEISQQWDLNLVTYIPLYRDINLESDFSEDHLILSGFSDISNLKMNLFNLSMKHMWNIYSLEFGLYGASPPFIIPYFSFAWRWS